jgi:hypothetical protein
MFCVFVLHRSTQLPRLQLMRLQLMRTMTMTSSQT